MSTQYPGGFITKSPVAPTTTAASGIWTVDQALQYVKAGTWPGLPIYIEDVFSTYLYTGTGATLTITNGIDLATKGGLWWGKSRSTALGGHGLVDTVRGRGSMLQSDTTAAAFTTAGGDFVTSFNTNGVTIGLDNTFNRPGAATVGWTFAEQPKFFDIVTYTGNGVDARAISHSLGATPGCIIIKKTSDVGNWVVGHRSLNSGTGNGSLFLNTTDAYDNNGSFYFGNRGTGTYIAPTSTQFTVSYSADVNANGATYVAYLFAHDAGGFGLTKADNVISCGSYTGNGAAGGQLINLGYEVQWVMIKQTNAAGGWWMMDVMRGYTVNGDFGGDASLDANASAAEANQVLGQPSALGFTPIQDNVNQSGQSYIYIAIRRGPMKVPTVGTSVFAPVTYASTNVDNRLVNTGIVTDMTLDRTYDGSSSGGFWVADRLRGDYFLGTAVTDAAAVDTDSFMTPTVGYGNSFSAQNGFGVGNDVTRRLNYSTFNMVAYAFARAPGFFDVVCYTGTGVVRTVTHNLGVAPELMIIKSRSNSGVNYAWPVYAAPRGATQGAYLNAIDEFATGYGTPFWNDTAPTASVFTLGDTQQLNGSGATYIAYLFATVAGVSNVGSFTGTAALQTINCGFTTGARFVLIKRADVSGAWYVWDSARGISSGTDPFLLVNSIAIQDATTNYVDTDTTGFKVTAAASTTVNISAATYIFFAIA